jgi:hypothetical protein
MPSSPKSLFLTQNGPKREASVRGIRNSTDNSTERVLRLPHFRSTRFSFRRSCRWSSVIESANYPPNRRAAPRTRGSLGGSGRFGSFKLLWRRQGEHVFSKRNPAPAAMNIYVSRDGEG